MASNLESSTHPDIYASIDMLLATADDLADRAHALRSHLHDQVIEGSIAAAFDLGAAVNNYRHQRDSVRLLDPPRADTGRVA